MKAITIYQPWASLITYGTKKYETRSWKTNYRGKIAIHVGLKKIDMLKLGYDLCCANFLEKVYKGVNNTKLDQLPCGVIIATAELVECWNCVSNQFIQVINAKNQKQRLIDDDECLFGDYKRFTNRIRPQTKD